MLAPKSFTQSVSEEAYVQAYHTAQAKIGVLRFTAPLMLATAALGLGGSFTIYNGGGQLAYTVTGIAMLIVSSLLAVWMLAAPKITEKQAKIAYATFCELSDPSQVTFTSDEMTLQGTKLTRRVEYAKTRVCIETAQRFVIITDDNAMVILEKEAFTDAEGTVDFLRDVFARWYTKK